jgi:hypothetical protein
VAGARLPQLRRRPLARPSGEGEGRGNTTVRHLGTTTVSHVIDVRNLPLLQNFFNFINFCTRNLPLLHDVIMYDICLILVVFAKTNLIIGRQE